MTETNASKVLYEALKEIERLRQALVMLPLFLRRSASAPLAGQVYRDGYEDGKDTVCRDADNYIHNTLNLKP